jgi:hypothetical protein
LEANAVKKWPWITILVSLACLLVLVGVAPWLYLLWWENAHNPKPLSVPLMLKRGEYTSPIFTTDLSDAYQIDLDLDRFQNEQIQLDLDWKIVDDSGTVIQQGAYREFVAPFATEVRLGEYRPRRGLRQRIIMRIHEDVQGDGANSRLVIGIPEIGLDIGEGYTLMAIEWMGVVAGSGIILFLVLLIRRMIRRNASASAS